MNEFELIKNYFQNLSKKNPSAKKLNDDVFFDKKKNLTVSIDTYNEGIHFPHFKYPELIIKKVIRASISDLLCKGVKPEYIFISASGNKRKFSKNNLKLISKSIKEEQKKYGLILSGGDTTNSSKVSFSITTLGFANKIVERNKAKLNDDIYITGNIGDSFLGLKIIQNKVKVNLKQNKYFLKQYYCPILPFIIHKYLKNNKKKKQNYLFNGDDYQILFTASKKNRKIIKKISSNMNQKITIIGKINNKFKKIL